MVLRVREGASDGGANRTRFVVEQMHADDPVRLRSQDQLPAVSRFRDRHEIGRQIEIRQDAANEPFQSLCGRRLGCRRRPGGRDRARMAAVTARDVENGRGDRLAYHAGAAAAALYTRPVVFHELISQSGTNWRSPNFTPMQDKLAKPQ